MDVGLRKGLTTTTTTNEDKTMEKTTKTATFKTFEAARLTAGKYAGMCINKSEEREHDGKFFTYYSSSARNVSRDWYALKASEIAAVGYDCLGFWDIPAGLKAASLMVCRLSNYSRNFRFSLDRSGAWMFHYDDPDGFEYSNGSAEDVKGDRVEMDDDQNARDFVWALSRFERVQLWENNGKIFMAVGSIDDGRLLLLNAGVNARFVSSDDDVWTVDPAAEVVAAVANYPAAPVAACEAPKAENGEETAQEGENARGGAEVHQEAETAPEAEETAKRDLSREFRRGDVVKITGTTNGRNGYFYVVDLHDDGTPYKLQGLKKCPQYDTFKDETTKKVEYWPLHTFASSPKVRAEFKEAVKFASISNFGPVSLAAYQALKRAHAETVEALERVKSRDGSGVYVDELTKREAEERADVERMREEAPELESLRQWKETHQKQEGPGLKICKNGLKVRNDDGTWEHYSLKIEKAHGYHNDAHAGEVEVWGSYYGNRSSTIPAGFGLGIINDSDSQTDYFEADRAFVKPDHPLFWAFAQAAEGGKPYTLTDDDAQRCAEYLETKRAEAEAERKAKEDAEQAERERKDAELCKAISDAVKTYSEEFPAVTGEATGRIIWSENNALYAESEETGKNTLFSLAALDLIISEADHAKKRIFGKECGYEKTKMLLEIPGGVELEERVDIGDGIGGIYESHLHTMEWHAMQAMTNGDDPKWVEAQKKGVERESHILEMLRPWCHIGGLLVLNDLEALELGETA